MGRYLSILLGVVLALCIGAAVAQVPAGCDCTDNPPDDQFTCEQQQEFGKCTEDWMINGGLCEFTCGTCTCDEDASEDAAPEEPEEAESEDAEDEEAEADDDADDAGDEDEDLEADEEAEADAEEAEEDAEADDEEDVGEDDAEALEEDEEADEDSPVVTLGDDDEDDAEEEDDAAEEEDAEEDVDEEDAAVDDNGTEDTESVGVILPDLTGDADEEEDDEAAEVVEEDDAAEEDPAIDEEEDPAVAEEDPAVDEEDPAIDEEDPALAEEEDPAVVEEDAVVAEEEEQPADAEEEETTAEEEDTSGEEEDTGDAKPLEDFADPEAACEFTLYEALNGGDETGAFATLLAAAGLDSDLGSEDDSYTVFAPTNEAVEDGVGALGISVDDLLSSPKAETVAKYHVVEGILEPATLKLPKQIETLSGDALIGGSVREIEGLGSSARIIGEPIPICNSLVYVVDGVLLPAADLAGISPVDVAPAPEDEALKEAACEEGFDGFFAISEDEELSILAEMLNTFALSAGLADGAVEYTIFAPTNDAFQKAAQTLETTVDDMLKDESTIGILEYHIIDSMLEGKDLLKEKSTDLESRNGTEIVMETNRAGTVAELFGVGSSAKVTDTDIDKSCTAAVHKVNNVLLPFKAASSGTGVRGLSTPTKSPASAPASATATTKKAPKKSGACQVGTQSLFEVLNQMPEISVFASIVSQAKLARIFTNKNLKVTVFAPMDFAFGNILPRGKGFFDLVPDVILAENLVSNHIVGKPVPSRLFTDGMKMKTALTNKGKPETLQLVEDELVFPTGLSLETAEITANITKLDIFACNSVIHLIDAVLIADPDVIPSKTVTATEALEASEPYASLLNPRDDEEAEEDDGVPSG